MPAAELVTDLASLEALQSEWDAIAVAREAPLMAPSVVLSWWRHLAPSGAMPRSVAVREAGRLIGVAPFYVRTGASRIDYRLPGIELAARLTPLALPGHDQEVAAATAQTLATAVPTPDLIALEGAPLASTWAAALRDNWPSRTRPLMRRYLVHGAPTISLGHPSYEDWLATKSANFRSQMRRAQRDFLAAGGTVRVSGHERMPADLDVFFRLHAARWRDRADSSIVRYRSALLGMLQEIASGDPAGQRLRLWVLETDGEPISTQLFIAAGGEVAYVNGGWAERSARLRPAMLGILYAIEDAFARGERRMDLGAGEQHYKRRLADGDDPVAWTILIPPGRRQAVTCARVAPMLASHLLRDAVKRTLPPGQLDRLRAARTRLRAWAGGR